MNALSLSGACHKDIAASTSSRHAGLSIACRLSVTMPKLSRHSSSSTVLSQVLPQSSRSSLPVFGRTTNAGPESSGVVKPNVATDDQRRTSTIDR